MIETIIKDYLDKKLNIPVFLEKPIENHEKYIVIDKTGSSKSEHLPTATIAFQSYAKSKYEAALLNEQLKESVEGLINLSNIRFVELNSDYSFPDITTKEHRYQAVYDIGYY